jgi:hypothetical protein
MNKEKAIYLMNGTKLEATRGIKKSSTMMEEKSRLANLHKLLMTQ